MTKKQAALAADDGKLRHAVIQVLASAWAGEYGIEEATRRVVDDVLVPWLDGPEPLRQFTAAHLRIVFLLAESQGSTHTRLRRAWDAKSARSGPLAWPWISDSGLRTRTAELKAWGLVEASGAYGETPAGRRSRIWQLTGVNPTAVGRTADPIPGVEPRIDQPLADLIAEARADLSVRVQLELAAEVAGVKL